MAPRRLLGASRFCVMAKYVSESVVFTFICFLLAFLLAKALLPVADDQIMRASVYWQTGKAARTNPASELKKE